MRRIFVPIKLNSMFVNLPVWQCSCGAVYGLCREASSCERRHEKSYTTQRTYQVKGYREVRPVKKEGR